MQNPLKFVTLLIGLPILFLMGCGTGSETAVSTLTPAEELATKVMAAAEATVDPTQFSEELAQARALWDEQNITNYTMQVRYNQPTWNVQILQVTVENGEVVDVEQSCFPQENCILRDVDATQFTIPQLLDIAANVGELGLPASDVDITFNSNYGYPNAIVYPDAFWNVESFTPENE